MGMLAKHYRLVIMSIPCTFRHIDWCMAPTFHYDILVYTCGDMSRDRSCHVDIDMLIDNGNTCLTTLTSIVHVFPELIAEMNAWHQYHEWMCEWECYMVVCQCISCHVETLYQQFNIVRWCIRVWQCIDQHINMMCSLYCLVVKCELIDWLIDTWHQYIDCIRVDYFRT